MKTEEAVKQILTAVNTLGNLMQRVLFSSVAAWDEKELQNAFRWAAYCQELAKKVDVMEKSFSSNLEQKMIQMSAKMTPQLPVSFNLAFLRRGVGYLLESLMNNPSLPEPLVVSMIKLVKTQYMHKILLDQLEESGVRECSVKAEEALTALVKVLVDDKSQPKAVDTSVRVILENLTIYLVASKRSTWFDIRLCSILNKWTQCPKGWFVLVSHLCNDLHKVEHERRGDMRRLMDIIVCWVVHQYTLYKKKCQLWKLPEAKLAELCEFNGSFSKWYLQELEAIGDRLAKQAELDPQLLATPKDTKDSAKPALKEEEGKVNSSAAASEDIKEERQDLEERLQQLLLRDSSIKKLAMSLIVDKIKGDEDHGQAPATSLWLSIADAIILRNTQ